MLRVASGDWQTNVYKDLDEAIALWNDFRLQSGGVGVLHVGLTRPVAQEFEELAKDKADRLLLSTSARWTFHTLGTYSNRLGFVGDLGLHMALSGWGYEVEEAPRLSGASGLQTEEAGWLQQLSESAPALASKVQAAGIVDEESYCAREENLDWATRRAIGLARMNCLMNSLDPDDPFSVIKASPPWLFNARLAQIDLTVRCSNALRGGELTYVSDVARLTLNELLKLPNFGRKSAVDLAQALRAAVEKGPLARVGDDHPKSAFGTSLQTGYVESSKAASGLASAASETVARASETTPADSFEHAFSAITSNLSPNYLAMLQRRIGVGSPPMTLNEIGDAMGVTRERVRQLESKIIGTFAADPIWRMELLPRLAALLSEREDPLPVESLGLFDPWFSGSPALLAELRFIVERVTEGKFHLLSINGCHVVTEISKAEWEAALKHAANLVEKGASEGLDKAELRRRVEELLPYRGRELAVELWSIAQRGALFATDEAGVERLVAVGTSAEALVAAALASAPAPVHFSELPKLVASLFGRELEVRRAHNAAGQVGLLYGRGTYGTVKHSPLDTEELALLREAAEDLVLAGTPGRQWSCAEMLDLLGPETLELGERANQYTLQIALRTSNVLTDLGRLMWKAKGEGGARDATRIDLSQAIISILESNGGPLTREQIREKLLRERGLNGYFQLHPRGSLIRMDARRWGLLERDVPLSSGEITQLRQYMADFLFHKQSGVHLTELATVCALHEGFRNAGLANETIHSILLADHRFKSSLPGYIYLAIWSGSRRLTQSEAVAEVLKNAGRQGIPVAQVISRASTLLGRQIERDSVYQAMVSSGARFDEALAAWVLLEEDETA